MTAASLLHRLRLLMEPDACISDTPVVPIHQSTLAEVIAALEELERIMAEVPDEEDKYGNSHMGFDNGDH